MSNMEAKTEIGFEDLLFKLVDKFPKVRSLKDLVEDNLGFDETSQKYDLTDMLSGMKISESTKTQLIRFLEILDYIQSMANVLVNSEPSNWISVKKFTKRLNPNRITKKEWKDFLKTIEALTPKINEKIGQEEELVYFPRVNISRGELVATYY